MTQESRTESRLGWTMKDTAKSKQSGSGKSTQSRGWILTLPSADYPQDVVERGLSKWPFVGQLESGAETGFEHWQVYIESASPIRFTTLKNLFPKGHFEARKGTKEQAFEYVTKEETSLGVRIQSGTIEVASKQGKRSDLDQIHDLIINDGLSAAEVLLQMPSALRYSSHMEKLQEARDNQNLSSKQRDVKAYYLHGGTGVGKSSGLIAFYGAENVYRVSSYEHPFDSYRNQQVLILDEFDGNVPFELLLNLLDRYPLLLPARYRDRYAAVTEVWLVSNLPLNRFYEDIRRMQPQRWAALLRRLLAEYELVSNGQVIVHYRNESSKEAKVESAAGVGDIQLGLALVQEQRRKHEEERRAESDALLAEITEE